MKINVCFGTRPEVIKLCLLSKRMREYFDVDDIFTGQHTTLFDDVKYLLNKNIISIDLNNNRDSMLSMMGAIIKELDNVFNVTKPDLIVVQGDTLSAYCASVVAFMKGIKIGHVEAGLRTNNLQSPFPEEFNRQTISKIAYYNWCPTEDSVNNLLQEKVKGKMFLTGNTVVDYVYQNFNINNNTKNNKIIVTLHRRENKEIFSIILRQLETIASNNKNLDFIFPAHPNPNIQKQLGIIKQDNIKIVSTMKYDDFLKVMSECNGIITDSGGIQEEAVCFNKKTLICRDTTERMESVRTGICRLVKENILDNFNWLITPLEFNITQKNNPFGDGHSCEKIISTIERI